MLSAAGFGENKIRCVFLFWPRPRRRETRSMRGVARRKWGAGAGGGVEGKSLLPSAARRKINPNNFIGIIASE